MVLYEYFNTTNQTIPVYSAHENFVGPIEEPSCASVEGLPYDRRCKYIVESELCSDLVQFIDYVYIYYCIINKDESEIIRVFAYTFNIMICLYYFVTFTVVVDKFFCPALSTLSKILHLSENIAGITLLTFANSAPDFLTSLSTIYEENKMLVSQVVGASLFTTTFIVGTIIAMKPLNTNKWIFLRDIECLLIVVLLLEIFMYPDNVITTRECMSFPFMYMVYIAIVFLDQHYARLLHVGDELSFISTFSYIKEEENCKNLVLDFITNLKPFTIREWVESSCLAKVTLLLTTPLVIGLKLLIPVVDSTVKNDGWCKLLNCVQIVLLPTAILSVQISSDNPNKWLWLSIISSGFLLLSITVFCCTKIAEKPRFHKCLIFLSAFGSMFVMWVLAHEVLNIIGLIGIVLRLSSAFIGCTLLAWGGCVGDLIADITLARHDFQEMAVSATFGSPMFNMLLSLGLALIYKSLNDESNFNVPVGSISHNCLIFQIIMLIFLIFGLFLTDFRARRSLGIFLISGYVIFLIGTILVHFEIIHAFGTDHKIDSRFQDSEVSFAII